MKRRRLAVEVLQPASAESQESAQELSAEIELEVLGRPATALKECLQDIFEKSDNVPLQQPVNPGKIWQDQCCGAAATSSQP